MNKRTAGAVCLAGAGLLMMMAGIWQGELAVILRKAANICLECIGIG